MEIETLKKRLEQLREDKIKFETELEFYRREKNTILEMLRTKGITEEELPSRILDLENSINKNIKEIQIPLELLK